MRDLPRRIRDRLRRSRWNPMGTLVHVVTEEPVAALTFDDGPDPEYTPPLLDVLEHHGAKATFFVIGASARRHPRLVRETAERGHCVANHTFSHPSLPSLPGRDRRREIRRCAKALEPHGSRFFRPPKGHQSPASRLDVLLCRHRAVAWNVAVDDWRAHEADWLAGRILERMSPGAIVLLHDGLWDPESPEAADRTPVVDAVRMVLEALGDRYRFVTLPGLLDRGTPIRHHWFNSPPEQREDGRE